MPHSYVKIIIKNLTFEKSQNRNGNLQKTTSPDKKNAAFSQKFTYFGAKRVLLPCHLGRIALQYGRSCNARWAKRQSNMGAFAQPKVAHLWL